MRLIYSNRKIHEKVVFDRCPTFKSIIKPSNGRYAVCTTSWKWSFSINSSSYDRSISAVWLTFALSLILATNSSIDILNSSVLPVKYIQIRLDEERRSLLIRDRHFLLDISGMIFHDGIIQIKAFEILHCYSLKKQYFSTHASILQHTMAIFVIGGRNFSQKSFSWIS